ncbi:MAG: heat-inducible transcriptional repressor HrcA [Ignavibacteria bacterium]|nr:heat-inducible transcriptional repressor HrcA [Ignavibacteria bacterium]
MQDILTNREKEILKYVVENFIRYATPIGSRMLSKKTKLNLSSATIRNIMSDLGEKKLLHTPHTSAGRVPTDKGLRYYVDTLMDKQNLKPKEIEFLKSQLEEIKNNITEEDYLFKETSKILGKISRQLSVVTQPLLNTGIFEKLELVQLASNRILVVINLKSGFVKTILMEIDTEITKSKLEYISALLNEKLSGLTLKEIRETYAERLSDVRNSEPELFQMFIHSIDKIYHEEETGGNVYIGGTGEIITQPEFDDPKNFKNIIELTENKDLVIHIFQNLGDDDSTVNISIGQENEDVILKDYSIICTNYKIGDIKGKLGIIGPRRINYAKMVSLLEYTSKLFSEIFS